MSLDHQCRCWWQLVIDKEDDDNEIPLWTFTVFRFQFFIATINADVDDKDDDDDKIPCRASPWWTRHRPRAPRWDLAHSWARPETEKEFSDVTPFYLTSLLPLTHPCLLRIVCQQTNKQTTEWYHCKHSLSLPGLKVRSLFTALKKSQANAK